MPAKDIWESLDQVLTKQRNITFDRYAFSNRKQLKGKPVKKFSSCLRELFLNCDLGSHEESIIRDVFTANMQDGEIQRESFKETRSSRKASKVAMNIEIGIQNELKMSGTALRHTTNDVTTTSINNIQSSWNPSRPLTSNLTKPTICPNYGCGWSVAQRQNCPVRGKTCKNCGIANHFAKVCRKPKQMKPKPRVNNVDATIYETATLGTSASVWEQVNHIDRLLQKHSIYDASNDSDYYDFDDNCVATISTNDNIREVEPENVNICIVNTNTKALVDSETFAPSLTKLLQMQ